MEVKNSFKPIDIKAVFREKSPRLSRFVPGFVYRYLTRIMHIDELNEIISNYGHTEGAEFTGHVIKYFNVTQEVIGLENIPPEGRFIFASNHPLGGFDSLLLIENVYKKLGELRFLVNDILMKIFPLKSIFVPIDKYGATGREAAAQLKQVYESDMQILIFPSGLASRKIKGVVTDLEWKKHFIQKAIEYKRDVIPVHISGQNSNFFYRLANLRKFLRIKWNLEIFFLSDETFSHRNKHVILKFGKPIPYSTFDKTKTTSEWANEVKKIVYSL